MIHEFNIETTKYFFNGGTLQLYSDTLPFDDSDSIADIENQEMLSKVTFVVANKCNGQCVYCYEQGGTFGRPSTFMNKAYADIALSHLFTNFKEIGMVSFFGGEPLINFDIIQ